MSGVGLPIIKVSVLSAILVAVRQPKNYSSKTSCGVLFTLHYLDLCFTLSNMKLAFSGIPSMRFYLILFLFYNYLKVDDDAAVLDL